MIFLDHLLIMMIINVNLILRMVSISKFRNIQLIIHFLIFILIMQLQLDVENILMQYEILKHLKHILFNHIQCI